MELLKYKEKYDQFFSKKNLAGAKALKAVQEDGDDLRYVREQTPEICLAAVQQNGCALRYVHNQTPEICMAAVRQDGYALQYVREQTLEICLAAVEQYDDALEFVDAKFFEEKEVELTKQEIADKFGIDIKNLIIKV